MIEKIKERNRLLNKAWGMLINNRNSKIVNFPPTSHVFFKTIKMSKTCLESKSKTKSFPTEIFDTSTDIYRPLTNYEIADLIHIGVEQFVKNLATKNTIESISINRNLFHIAIAKKSEKEKEFYYKKTLRRIKKLRTLLGY
tara:strand:- start:931 stop:1353 length:423 start_codon:yes stop_codon:yes gene_type:complete